MNKDSSEIRSRVSRLYNQCLVPIHKVLTDYIRNEEAAYEVKKSAPDTLAGHLDRVAAHAVRLALQESADPLGAEIAGLFHDAGKFRQGKYHEDDTPEEEHSIFILRDMGNKAGLDPAVLDAAAGAIAQLYRDDPNPTELGRILFDADNLDKIGLPGIALYFIKSGLRGRGLSMDLIIRLTVELTYARYSTRALFTETARKIAGYRSAETVRFIMDFLNDLREDGLFDTRIEQLRVGDLDLDVIVPAACPCGSAMQLTNWIEKGTKCTEIHLEMLCPECSNRHKIRFCRPRLIA